MLIIARLSVARCPWNCSRIIFFFLVQNKKKRVKIIVYASLFKPGTKFVNLSFLNHLKPCLFSLSCPMDCSLLYPPSNSIFDINPYSLHYIPHDYVPIDIYCLSNSDLGSLFDSEPPTPSFSEPSIVSTVTQSSSPRKRKRTDQSQGEQLAKCASKGKKSLRCIGLIFTFGAWQTQMISQNPLNGNMFLATQS